MVRNIEIYNGKYVDIDLDKVKRYLGNIFLAALLCVLFIIPNSVGNEFMSSILFIREISFLVISFFFMLALILIKILDKDYKMGIYEIIICIYSALIILSCFFSEYKYNVLSGFYARGEGALTLFAYIICFYIMKETFTYNDKIFKLLTLLLIFASFLGLMQALNKTGYDFKIYKTLDDWKYMACSNFDNPNMFSSLLSLFVPIYLFAYIKTNKKSLLVVLTLLFSALITAKTTGGYITFVIYFISTFMYYIITNRNKKYILKKYLIMLSTFLSVFILLNIINDNAYINEFFNVNKIEYVGTKNTNNKIESVDSLTHGRISIWKLSLNMIKENILWGVGPDSMGCEMKEKYRELYWSGFAIDKAHSEYLHIGVTTGLPSLIVYVFLIVYILINMLKMFIYLIKEKGANHNETIMIVAVSASVLSYLFQASANISTFCVAPFFWCMLGIAVNLVENKYNKI